MTISRRRERVGVMVAAGRRGGLRVAVVALLLGVGLCGPGLAWAEEGENVRRLPKRVELHDQYERPHRWEYPHTNLVLLTIADRTGAPQVDAWIEALKHRYAGRVEWRGLAQVEGVPEFWRGRIRRKFQETHRYPVLLDWTGAVCRDHGYRPKVANLLVVDGDGAVVHRVTGPATAAAVQTATVAIDGVLASSARRGSEAGGGLKGAGEPGSGASTSPATRPAMTGANLDRPRPGTGP